MKVLIGVLCSESVSSAEVVRCVRSVYEQESHPFDYRVRVICNTNDSRYTETITAALQDAMPDSDWCVFETASNGGNGMGHNSVMDHYKQWHEDESWTHLMMIDGDDFYYPCAFECIDEIYSLVEFDYLSNMQFTDSIRVHETHQDHKEVVPGVWLHSDFNRRHPIPSYVYHDGYHCSGGEVTLCVSTRAVMCDLKHMEIPNIPDDFTHMLRALKASVEGKLVYVNTDCNDVYVYDKTNPVGTTNQPSFIFDPDGWPEAERELLRGNTFASIRGLNRQSLPWVTIPQVMMPEDKIAFVKENLINKGQY